MKKLAFLFLISVFLLFCLQVVLSQEDLPAAGTLPDSPFYGFKIFGERVRLWLTFNETERAILKLQLAEVRLAEFKNLMSKNETRLAERVGIQYESDMDEVNNYVNRSATQGKNVTELAEHVSNRTYKHILVLQRILEKAPDEAKPTIERVINKSIIIHNATVERIKERLNDKCCSPCPSGAACSPCPPGWPICTQTTTTSHTTTTTRTASNETENETETITATENTVTEESKTFENIKVGDHFNITVSCNPSTGYSWWIKNYNSRILKSTNNGTTDCSDLIGGECTCFFEFGIMKSGSTTVKLLKYRSWEGEGSAIGRHNVFVSIKSITTNVQSTTSNIKSTD